MRFLGSCEVCNQTIHTYRGLGQHLRFHTDAEHQALKERWYNWRAFIRLANTPVDPTLPCPHPLLCPR